mmetsp:Transcript_105782/g.294465  ORF Transcript_105782/g.294465 Transcript_105782/m.294465 type:complete len:219 (+) Transcript_105782:788-1444(+)
MKARDFVDGLLPLSGHGRASRILAVWAQVEHSSSPLCGETLQGGLEFLRNHALLVHLDTDDLPAQGSCGGRDSRVREVICQDGIPRVRKQHRGLCHAVRVPGRHHGVARVPPARGRVKPLHERSRPGPQLRGSDSQVPAVVHELLAHLSEGLREDIDGRPPARQTEAPRRGLHLQDDPADGVSQKALCIGGQVGCEGGGMSNGGRGPYGRRPTASHGA